MLWRLLSRWNIGNGGSAIKLWQVRSRPLLIAHSGDVGDIAQFNVFSSLRVTGT